MGKVVESAVDVEGRRFLYAGQGRRGYDSTICNFRCPILLLEIVTPGGMI